MKAIMYHYVRKAHPELPFFKHLELSEFQKQLDLFEKQYGFVTKEEFLNALAGGPVPQGCVLTFDDGLKDHREVVLPELKRRGLWGMFYVTTSTITAEKMLDVHRIHFLLGKFASKMLVVELKKRITDEMLSHDHVEEFKTLTYDDQDNDEATTLFKRLLNYFISYEWQEKVIDELMLHFVGRKHVKNWYMNEAEIKELVEEGMLVGNHTVHHKLLSKLSTKEQEEEIILAFKYLNSLLPHHPKHFCFPYGGFHSFNKDSIHILKEQDCQFAFNVEHRDINEKDLRETPLTLPRYDCNAFPHGQCLQ